MTLLCVQMGQDQVLQAEAAEREVRRARDELQQARAHALTPPDALVVWSPSSMTRSRGEKLAPATAHRTGRARL